MATEKMGVIRNKVSEMVGRRRMTVADLAREAKISYDAAKKLYYGHTTRIDMRTLANICSVLECEVGDLFVFVPEGE